MWPGFPLLKQTGWRIVALGTPVVLLIVTAGSCGDDEGNDAAPTAEIANSTASPTAASELPTPPPGLTARFLDPAEVQPSDVPAEELEAYRSLVEEVISDVGRFWRQWFDEESEASWTPPELVDRAPEASIECDGVDVQNVGGSFYCPPDNYVAFEENRQLLPLYMQIGPYAVAMVIAHEFGHAVQRDLGIEYVGSDAQELQADCFAGVWFRAYQAEGGFSDPEQPFLQAYGAMRTVSNGRDLLERFDALSAGFLEGVEPCLDLVAEDRATPQPGEVSPD